MVSKGGIPGTAKQLPTLMLESLALWNESCFHELAQIGLHRLPDGSDHQNVL